MAKKKAKLDSTTKSYAAKKKTAKPSDLGSGQASKAAKALRDRRKMLDSI